MSGDTIVVLTALDLEYQAVRERMTGLHVHRHSQGTQFETGRLSGGTCRLALGLVGKGNHAAAVLIERAIETFRPVALLFAGVAGGPWPNVRLGDVVVATHVYAYHGATADDDSMKARPRSWEIPHSVDQLARYLVRTGDWTRDLNATPTVHFGPIAAGEVAQYSNTSANAEWIRTHYNDAYAIEMEGAGVAQAAHLNLNLPVVVVRGISDKADGTKPATDAAGWQPRAVAHAAAFAVALADALVADHADVASQDQPQPDGSSAVTGTFQNLATGNARVGVQAGQVSGGIHLGRAEAASATDLADAFAQLRALLREAYQQRDLDKATYTAADAEVTAASTAPDAGTRTVALKRLRGLVGDILHLASAVSAILVLVGAVS
jgi:8-oxo-dGTP diphosphatase